MEKIQLGNKEENTEYGFRETCFGIYYKNGEFYLTKKRGEYSLIGGGIENNEEPLDCLKREFLEESGLKITSITDYITIDCYWITKTGFHMNSLANFYIVEIDDDKTNPTEDECELAIVTKNAILSLLPLPYQKKVIEIFLEKNSN